MSRWCSARSTHLAKERDGLPQQAQATDDLLAWQVLLAVRAAVVAMQRTLLRLQPRTLGGILRRQAVAATLDTAPSSPPETVGSTHVLLQGISALTTLQRLLPPAHELAASVHIRLPLRSAALQIRQHSVTLARTCQQPSATALCS